MRSDLGRLRGQGQAVLYRRAQRPHQFILKCPARSWPTWLAIRRFKRAGGKHLAGLRPAHRAQFLAGRRRQLPWQEITLVVEQAFNQRHADPDALGTAFGRDHDQKDHALSHAGTVVRAAESVNRGQAPPVSRNRKCTQKCTQIELLAVSFD